MVRGRGKHCEDLALTPGEVGAREGPEQRAGGMSWAPSGCSGARQEQGWLLLWSRRCERRGEIPAPGWLLKEARMGLADVGCERMQVSRLVWSPDPGSEKLACITISSVGKVQSQN